MLFLGQATALDQGQGQGDEAGHQDRMQDEDTDIQAQQVGVTQGRSQGLLGDARFAVLQRPVRRRHDEGDQGHADHRHGGRGQEQPGQAEGTGQQGANHHGHGKRQADAHADHGHGFGPVLLAGKVRKQRHHCRRNRPGTLQDTSGNHPPDRVGLGRQHAAQGKDHQAQVDHRTTTDAIGNDPERNLQECLGQAIGTNGQANQRRRGASQVHAIGRQHRQDHEHAQHTEGEHQGQAACGAGFAATHAFAVGIVHG
ncbi:hypothetical protein D3C81_1401520 [compost metagenome]